MQNTNTTNSQSKTRSARPQANRTEGFEDGADEQSETSSTSQSASAPKSAGAKQGKETEQKSIGAVIAQSLAQDTQASVDSVINELNGYFDATKTYVRENPREALALGASLGMAAWALLSTQPGRKVFDRGAAVAVPEISRWIARNFSGLNR